MGPRLDSRKDWSDMVLSSSSLSLEWGHDWIVVETRRRAIHRHAIGRLEWGHDWIVVETFRQSLFIYFIYLCLNGATTG